MCAQPSAAAGWRRHPRPARVDDGTASTCKSLHGCSVRAYNMFLFPGGHRERSYTHIYLLHAVTEQMMGIIGYPVLRVHHLLGGIQVICADLDQGLLNHELAKYYPDCPPVYGVAIVDDSTVSVHTSPTEIVEAASAVPQKK